MNLELFSENLMKKEKNLWLIKTIVYYFLGLFLAFMIFIIIFSFIYPSAEVIGESMYPTLNNISGKNDIVYIDTSYKNFSYGDIVVVNKKSNKDIVKRIIAIGNDKINYKLNTETLIYEVYINNRKINETYTNGNFEKGQLGITYLYDPLKYLRDNQPSRFDSDGNYILNENEVFVMGDNRQNSTDSRIAGAYDLSALEGKVKYVIKGNESRFVFFINLIFRFSNIISY